MNLIKKLFKSIPNGKKESIEIIQVWRVTWRTYGEFNSDINTQCEFCISEEGAKKLKVQIEEAYTLIKSKASPYVEIHKQY